MQTTRIRFKVGEWLVEPQLNRITGPGGSTVVEPKVMHVLVCLADRPGAVVTRDELLERVWGGTVVTDYVVSRSISQLRKLFEDAHRTPRFIETVSKTGYRLIAPVTDEAPMAPHAGDSFPECADDIEIVPSAPGVWVEEPFPARSRTRNVAGAVLGIVVLAGLVYLGVVTFARPKPMPSTPLTSFIGVEQSPVFSPDGELLAFERYDEHGRSDIYVRMIGAESVIRLTEDPALDVTPTWTPDGRHVAFLRLAGASCGVYLVPALGGAERKQMDCPPSQRGLDWSPDGDWLVATDVDSASGLRGLVLVDAATQARRPFPLPPPGQSDFLPRFSPDGQWIAFSRGPDRSIHDLYVIPIDGRQAARRLTFDERDLARFSWAPDSRSLVFSSNRSGDYRLWRIDAAGGEPEWVAGVNTLDPGGPALSPAGGHVAYEEWAFEINIWEVTLDAVAPDEGAPRRVFASTRWDFQPTYAPDGRRVAFVSNRSGRPELWVGEVGAETAAPLASLDGAFIQSPRWSPDGRHIAFNAYAGGQFGIYVVDAQGGTPQRLTGDGIEARAPSWSLDGAWVFFASNTTGRWEVWKMPAGGGDAIQVTREGGYQSQEASDGRLFVSRYGQAGLWRRTREGEESRVLPELAVSDYGNWAVVGDDLLFVKRDRAGAAIHRLDLRTGRDERVAALPAKALSHESGLALSPDGTRALVAFVDRAESDIMMAGWEE